MKNKRLSIILASIAFILLVPLVAMQFTDELNWTISDFAVMGLLLIITGLGCEWLLRKVTLTKYRVTLLIIILATFFLIWAELAVGLLGTPFAGS